MVSSVVDDLDGGGLGAESDRLRTAEQRLALAVLEGAFIDIQAGWLIPEKHVRFYRAIAAIDWFLSPERFYPHAFENVCDHLDINAEIFRAALRRWCQSHSPVDGLTFAAFWTAMSADNADRTMVISRYFPRPKPKKRKRREPNAANTEAQASTTD